MRSYHKLLPGLLILIVFLGSVCHGATITGTVRGPDGAPFAGAFIQAQNTKSGITVMVLSDDQGRFRVEKLPGGAYQVRIKAVGYSSDSHPGLNLTADQNASVDVALQKGMIHWNDLSIYQAGKLWPASAGMSVGSARRSACA